MTTARKPKPRKPKDPTVDSMLAFVRAGGTVPLRDWLLLPAPVQAVLERAGTAVRAEFALAVATALRSAAGAAEVAATVDGGAAADEIRIADALDKGFRLLRKGSG